MYGTDVYEYAEDVLSHHGILGMKWGIRRYQNKDGTLTEEGKRRRGASESSGKEATGRLSINKIKRRGSKYIRSTEEYKSIAKDMEDVFESDEYKTLVKEADDKWKKLVDSSDDTLWKEYSEYNAKLEYPDDPAKQKELYDECMAEGRGSIDWTTDAWHWLTYVKDPALERNQARIAEMETSAYEKVGKKINAMLGEDKKTVMRTEKTGFKYHPKHDVTAYDEVLRTLQSDFPDSDVNWMVRQYYYNATDGQDDKKLKHSDEDHLSHHGILGMKWGVRRYQNKDGTLTDAGKRRLGASESADERRKKKARAKALEKARKTRAEKAEHERQKQEALKKGSAEDVLKFKGELTEKEMTDALSRLRLEKQLSDLTPKDVDKGRDALSSVISKVNSVSKALNTAANIAESSKRLRNALGFKDEPEETTTQKIANKMLKDLDEQTGPVDKYPKFNPTNKDGLDSALAWLEKRQKLEDVASGKRINTKKKNK